MDNMRISSRAIVIKDDSILVMDRDKFGHKFLAIPGGGVENGETEEQAAIREVKEECSVTIENPKLIIIEDAGNNYGLQYIYLCDYVSGVPILDPFSEEAQVASRGKNLYLPKWLPLSELKNSNLLPAELKELLVKFIETGFPQEPVNLKIPKDSAV